MMGTAAGAAAQSAFSRMDQSAKRDPPLTCAKGELFHVDEGVGSWYPLRRPAKGACNAEVVKSQDVARLMWSVG